MPAYVCVFDGRLSSFFARIDFATRCVFFLGGGARGVSGACCSLVVLRLLDASVYDIIISFSASAGVALRRCCHACFVVTSHK